jgi:uncharacterized membrane protein
MNIHHIQTRASPSAKMNSISEVNVGWGERKVSAALGGVLLMRGLRRGLFRGAASTLVGGALLYRGISGRCRLYQAFDISTARPKASHTADALKVERYITIGKPADELYRLWREPQILSRIMGPFAKVTAINENRQHWVVRSPSGHSVEWDAQIMEEQPGELLRWESLAGAELPNEGSVHFRPAPAAWGTEVALRLRFHPPGGALGASAMRLLGVVPRTMVTQALRRFKSLVETGEIPTLEHNPSARTDASANVF